MVEIKIQKSEFAISNQKIFEIKQDLKFQEGCYRLSGANGSGKTFFLDNLTGFVKNNNIIHSISKKKILQLGEIGIGMEELTILENIKMIYWIFHADFSKEVLDKVKTIYPQEQLATLYSQASFGMQLMVGLSLLFSKHEWELIALDETFAGVDEKNRKLFVSELNQRAAQSIIIVVSHENNENFDNFKEILIHEQVLQFNSEQKDTVGTRDCLPDSEFVCR